MTVPSRNKINSRILTAFGLRQGNSHLIAVMIFYSAAISVATTVGYKGVATGLFLSKLPPSQTPYLFILPAISVSFVLLLYNHAVTRMSMQRAMLGSLALLVIIVLLFRALLQTPYGDTFAVLAGLYVFMEAAVNLLTVQYWNFAGDLFNPREARRVFGLFIGSNMTAGIVAGGLLGPLGALMGVPNLLVVAALAIAAVWAFARIVLGHYQHNLLKDSGGVVDTEPDDVSSSAQAARAVWKTPLLRAIAGLTVMVSLLTNIGSYQFSLALQSTYRGQDQAMIAFLGNFTLVVRLAALITQFYIAPRLLRRLGLVATLLIYPVSKGLAATGSLLVGGGLPAATAITAPDEVFRWTLHETGINILYLPLRMRAKELLNVAYAATFGLAGVIFLAAQAIGPLPYVFWSAPIVVLAVASVWLVQWARREYIGALAENIKRRQFDFDASTLDVTDETTVQVLANILRQSDELQVLHGLELIASAPGADWTPHVSPLLSHPSEEVRTQALRYMGRTENAAFSDAITELLNAPEESVRATAIEVFCGMGGRRAAERVAPFLDDPSPRVRAAAIVGLAQHGSDDDTKMATSTLRAMLEDLDPQARSEGLRVLGALELPEMDSILISLLDDPDAQVRVDAVRLVGDLGNPQHMPVLIRRLKDRATAAIAVEVLAQYGSASVQQLGQVLENASEDHDLRSQIPKVLAHINDEPSAQLLLAHLSEPDDSIRSEIHSALRQLSDHGVDFQPAQPTLHKAALREMQSCYALFVLREDVNGDGQDPLLNEALTLRLRRALRRVFDLLSVLHKGQDMEQVRQALESDLAAERTPNSSKGARESTKRAHAIELLDNLAESNLRELLVPILEAPPAQVLALARKQFSLEREALFERLQELAADTDPWVQASALWRIGADSGSSDPRLQTLLLAGLESPDSLVRETAAAVARKQSKVKSQKSQVPDRKLAPEGSEGSGSGTLDLGPSILGETAPMPVSTIERVLILKSVDLFAGIPAQQLIAVAGLAREVSLKSGETFLRQGDLADCLYITITGDTGVHIKGVGRVAIRPAPTVFGEMAIILSQPRSADCIALTDIIALKIDSAPFQQLLAEDPTLALAVIKVLAGRLDDAQRQTPQIENKEI